MTNVALVVMTDGRRDCIARTVPAAVELLSGIGPVVICDDSGDPEYAAFLTASFPDAQVVSSPARSGYSGAVQRAWAAAIATGAPWAFMLEDDFVMLEPVDLAPMIEVMEARPYLTQLLLKRQAWYGHEVAAGGLIEADPSGFTEVTDGTNVWCEHQRGHWSNPHLVRRSFLESHRWPDGDWSESRFGQQVMRGRNRSAIWRAADAPPVVEHIGVERVGHGY